MNLLDCILILGSLLLTAQSAYSAWLMLYAWEDEDRRRLRRAPATYEPPRRRFTILLPATKRR